MRSLQRDPLYLEFVHFYMIIYVHLYLSIYILPKNLRKLGRGSFLKSAISEWRCDGGVKKYEKSAFNYIDAADGYAIDMNTLTKLYQELLYTNATTDVSYWVKTIWNWLIM